MGAAIATPLLSPITPSNLESAGPIRRHMRDGLGWATSWGLEELLGFFDLLSEWVHTMTLYPGSPDKIWEDIFELMGQQLR